MKRQLKQLVRRFLPASLVQRIKTQYVRQLHNEVFPTIRLEEGRSVVRCHIPPAKTATKIGITPMPAIFGQENGVRKNQMPQMVPA